MRKSEIRCELRYVADPDGGPGRLVGTLMREGDRAKNLPERFTAGALVWPSNGVLLREMHNRQAPILRILPERRGADVVIDQQLPDTQRGRDAALMVRNGTLPGLSIEFLAEQDAIVGGLREVRRARLTGAGLVDDPEYRDSKVEVRSGVEGQRYLWR